MRLTPIAFVLLSIFAVVMAMDPGTVVDIDPNDPKAVMHYTEAALMHNETLTEMKKIAKEQWDAGSIPGASSDHGNQATMIQMAANYHFLYHRTNFEKAKKAAAFQVGAVSKTEAGPDIRHPEAESIYRNLADKYLRDAKVQHQQARFDHHNAIVGNALGPHRPARSYANAIWLDAYSRHNHRLGKEYEKESARAGQYKRMHP